MSATLHETVKSEGGLGLLYSLTACVGFATDAAVLVALSHLHMTPAFARLISLTTAMQVTFWINGLFVFRCLHRKNCVGAWLGYMATNGFGNLANYWVFVTLASLHHPVLSNRWVGLVVGGGLAWSINFLSARYLIFGVRGPDGTVQGCISIGEVGKNLAARFGRAPQAGSGAFSRIVR